MSFIPDQTKGYRHPFVSGVTYLGGVGDVPRTLTELAMCQCSAEIRSRPNWWKTFNDPAIRKDWAEEINNRIWRIFPSGPEVQVVVKLSPPQIDYLLDELAGYAALRDPVSGCQVSCFERIWESTCFPDPSILTHQLSLLRCTTLTSRKSSPLVHLVDPFLYPLVYDKTYVCTARVWAGTYLLQHGKSPPQPRLIPSPNAGIAHTICTLSALLPSNVYIPPPGLNRPVKFVSYINNLHPQTRADVYESLSSFLTCFVPLFERTLTDLHRNNPLMQRIQGTCRYTVWDEPEEPEFSDDEEGWSKYEDELKNWIMNRPIQFPDVPEKGYTGGLEKRKYMVSLGGKTVQVIVDVTEIQLEPGDAPYNGSQWHVEGMRNERIVACGLYYTSVQNLTPSSIEFRMAVTFPRGFMGGDTGATLRTWGLRNGDPCHQCIGSRVIEQGLAITFPNIYQHRQTGFTLLDPTQPGHQTIVSFFLVDPDVEIISTAEVAPQQREWVRMAVDEAMDERIPKEVLDQIVDSVERVMDLDEAEKHADALREVREKFRESNDLAHFCIPFDIFCGPDSP